MPPPNVNGLCGQRHQLPPPDMTIIKETRGGVAVRLASRACPLRSRGVSPPRGTFHKNPLLLEAKLTLLANESLVRVVDRSVVL